MHEPETERVGVLLAFSSLLALKLECGCLIFMGNAFRTFSADKEIAIKHNNSTAT